jgi:hypothetical protein
LLFSDLSGKKRDLFDMIQTSNTHSVRNPKVLLVLLLVIMTQGVKTFHLKHRLCNRSLGKFCQPLPLSHQHLQDFETDSKDGFIPDFEDIEELVVETVTKQEQLKKSVNILEQRVIKDENEVQDIVKIVYKILPILSIVLSLCGIAFQVFVLYPWHEELSYEFKQLEQSIIQLDKKIERPLDLKNDLNMELTLRRPTGS